MRGDRCGQRVGPLDRQQRRRGGLVAGVQVADGGYTATALSRGRCGDLGRAWTRPDLFENARTLGLSSVATFVGLGGTPSQDVLDLASAWGIPAAAAIGGKIRVPFAFDGSEQTMDALVTYTKVIRGELDLDGSGNLVYQDASASLQSGRPAAGYYRINGVFTFAPPF